MSEPMFPSSAGAAAPAQAEPTSGGGSRKALIAVGGVVAALAVGAGAFVLLSGSGASQDASGAVVPHASAPAAPAPSASAAAKPVTTTVKTASVTSRDPFAALFAAPAAAAPAAPAPAAPAASGSSTVGQTPMTPKVAVTVSSVDPVKQTAVVAVNGTKYSVSVGKTFATTFMLYSVFNAQCVGVLFGDQSVPVCVSQPQLVSP